MTKKKQIQALTEAIKGLQQEVALLRGDISGSVTWARRALASQRQATRAQ